MYLIGGKTVDMTAEVAAKVYQAWDNSVGRVAVSGSIYATHQICSIEKIKGQELKDLCSQYLVDTKDAPSIENFLSNKKLLK